MSTDNSTEMFNFTIETLNKSGEEIKSLQAIFLQTSEHFEAGRDNSGLEMVQNMVNQLNHFAEFCSVLRQQCIKWVAPETLNDLDTLNQRLVNNLTDINSALESGDVLELGDILRTELYDSMGKYKTVFTQLKKDLQETVAT